MTSLVKVVVPEDVRDFIIEFVNYETSDERLRIMEKKLKSMSKYHKWFKTWVNKEECYKYLADNDIWGSYESGEHACGYIVIWHSNKAKNMIELKNLLYSNNELYLNSELSKTYASFAGIKGAYLN